MEHSVHVELAERAYHIKIAENILERTAEFLGPLLCRSRVAIITDDNIRCLHLDVLVDGLSKNGISSHVMSLPPGEVTKTWPYLIKSVEWMLDLKIERNDLILALGGGVIGDLVGFAAASLRRGVRFVQIPTSLLAQVDSSVGGKTGINSRQGKNLIGAFHQPSMVLTDISLLDTLSERDFLAGFGEVVKYGLLGDGKFFEWLEKNGSSLVAGDREKRAEAVRVSCQMKADIVKRDETEQGERALLNLGHTFCHALEAATGYSDRLLHGEGVTIGCNLAFELSVLLGICAEEHPARIRAYFKKMGMKTDMSDIKGALPTAEELIELMHHDKKVVDGQLRFILPRDIGVTFATSKVPVDLVLKVLKEHLSKR